MVFTNKRYWGSWLKKVDCIKYVPYRPTPIPANFKETIDLLLKRNFVALKWSNLKTDFYDGP